MRIQPTSSLSSSSPSTVSTQVPTNTDTSASQASSLQQRTYRSFTTISHDVLGRFVPPRQGGPVPIVIAPEEVAKNYNNGQGYVGALPFSAKDLIVIFSPFSDLNAEELLYSATDLTSIFYTDRPVSEYFSSGIRSFFQDALEDAMFDHPDWTGIDSRGQVALRAPYVKSFIEHLISSKGIKGPEGKVYVNILHSLTSQQHNKPFTCVKLENGVLKYSSSLESLVQQLINFRESRVLLNRALDNRKITILDGVCCITPIEQAA